MRRIYIKDRIVKVPTEWSDISVGKFQESVLLKSTGSSISELLMIKLLTGVDTSVKLDSDTNQQLMEALSFMHQEIPYDETPIKIDGAKWEIIDMNDITYFQNITIEGILNRKPNDMASILSVLLRPLNDPNFKFEGLDDEFIKKVSKIEITKVFGTYMYYFTFIKNLTDKFKELYKKKMMEVKTTVHTK